MNNFLYFKSIEAPVQTKIKGQLVSIRQEGKLMNNFLYFKGIEATVQTKIRVSWYPSNKKESFFLD